MRVQTEFLVNTRLEPIENLMPVALIAGASAMAFINDYWIEEIARKFSVKYRAITIAMGLVK
jgi:hypothetical protein